MASGQPAHLWNCWSSSSALALTSTSCMIMLDRHWKVLQIVRLQCAVRLRSHYHTMLNREETNVRERVLSRNDNLTKSNGKKREEIAYFHAIMAKIYCSIKNCTLSAAFSSLEMMNLWIVCDCLGHWKHVQIVAFGDATRFKYSLTARLCAGMHRHKMACHFANH